ncbi:unnamed protein product [Closterium sp. NIES-65]|nr:unnamed protein product [Closterium sp. NIES-65]
MAALGGVKCACNGMAAVRLTGCKGGGMCCLQAASEPAMRMTREERTGGWRLREGSEEGGGKEREGIEGGGGKEREGVKERVGRRVWGMEERGGKEREQGEGMG